MTGHELAREYINANAQLDEISAKLNSLQLKRQEVLEEVNRCAADLRQRFPKGITIVSGNLAITVVEGTYVITKYPIIQV